MITNPGARRRVGTVVICLFLAAGVVVAQNQGTASVRLSTIAPNSVLATRNVLADKARASEGRGRPDMALQLWQQIQLSDPKNIEALAGDRERCLAAGSKHLRACYPMDIYRLVKAISEYEGRPVWLTRVTIDRAVGLYFAKRVAAVSD